MDRRVVRGALIGAALLTLCFVTTLSRAEESKDGLWSMRASNAAPSADARAWWSPAAYRSVTLDTSALDGELANAALEGTNVDARTDGVEISLPLADGSFQRFAVLRTNLLSAPLQASFPGLTTYAGVGVDDPEAIVACTRSVLGFQCMIRSPAGVTYIDPLYRGDDEIHAVYDYESNTKDRSFACKCEETAAALAAGGASGLSGPAGLVTSGATRREFRLAVAMTGEYWQFWGSTPAAIAGVTATINNVRSVQENDLTLRVNLNFIVVNTDPTTDPYTGTHGNLNAEVQGDLDANVGDANYDIGHLFDSFGGSISGNAGCIGCICSSGSKGSAWSDGGPNPTGGNMDFLVLHEMGHQLGGRHTFTGTGCSAGQWDSNSSVEPGSGSTIMSYSSICGADNVLGGAVGDLYYHADSIDRIVTNTSAVGCRADVATGNSAPSVSAQNDITIPGRTPFALFAAGSDPDSDPLTYCWEQMDVSPNSYPLNQADTGDNPLFRSYPPVATALRFFPQLSDILAGNLFPGTLGEQLPSTNRTMEFWVTARDNVANGGGIDQDSMIVTVDASTGPFRVLSPNGGESIATGIPTTITWDPAGTTGGGVNVANVQISLSVDGGATLPNTPGLLIAASTPNDGSFSYTFTCDQLTSNARIRIAAVTGLPHYWFDWSDNDFTIEDVLPPVVTCNMTRTLLWPARFGLTPTGFSWNVLADNCDPTPTRTLSIYSTEATGAAPYAPDWTFVAPFDLRLRAERAFPGPGRVYVVVVNATDASGNRGVDCCSTIVPVYPVGAHILALRATALAAEAACLASPTDTAPPGFVPLVQGVPLP